MPKRGGATRGGDTDSGGERSSKKARVEKVEGVEALHAIIAEQATVIAQKDAVIAQQAAALLDELIPHPPSDVWAESHFSEHATLRWTPCATGVVASELAIGAIDDATRERVDDLGRATSDAIGACIVDPRLVAGRGLRDPRPGHQPLLRAGPRERTDPARAGVILRSGLPVPHQQQQRRRR